MRGLWDPMAWTLMAPLIGACLTFVRRSRVVVIATLVASVAAAAALVRATFTEGARRLPLGAWDPPLGIALQADGLSVFMVATNAGVGLLISIYALSYLPVQHESDRGTGAFWPLWFFAWVGLNGLYLSGDLFNLYVALEVLGISAVALVSLAGGQALVAGIRYALVTLLGSMLFLAGVGLLYGAHGVVDMAEVGRLLSPGPIGWTALALMTAGMAMKTALLPLHFWLPPAHARALGPVSALLSALVVKGTFYLVVRLWLVPFPTVITPEATRVLGALGVVAILWGSAQAMREDRLKRLVAFSTVAQVGYFFLVFPLGLGERAGAAAWQGGMYLVATHACAKAAMFLAAGTLKHATGTDDLARVRGLAVRAPVTVFSFALAGVTLIGLPPSGGFLAKWMLLSAALETGQPVVAAVIVAGSLLAAMYVFAPVARMFRSTPEDEPSTRFRIPLGMEASALILAVLGLLLGLASHMPLNLLQAGDPFRTAMGTP